MVGIHCLLDHQAGRRESPDQGGQPLFGRPSTVVDCDLPYPQEAGAILNIFCVGIYILQQLPSFAPSAGSPPSGSHDMPGKEH